MSSGTLNKRRLFTAVATLAIVAAIISAWTYWGHSSQPVAPAVAAASAPTDAVSAMGRFEPMEPVTHVTAPYIEGHPATIAQIKVAEGDHVRAGQLIAVLTERDHLDASVHEATARVTSAELKLSGIEQLPRPSDVAARAAEAERWQEAARTAQADFERYQSLRATHDVSASDVENKRNQMINAQQMLEIARAGQAALTERHAQDTQAAQAELDAARAQLRRAQLDAANADVRAPADGIILHVRARPGEQAGPQGIVELARTAQMDVLAEVYETDINRVHLGEHAQVTSNLLAPGTKLTGTVVDIGREVGRAALASGDSAAFADARVVLVRVRLAHGAAASNLIDGKASVVLQP